MLSNIKLLLNNVKLDNTEELEKIAKNIKVLLQTYMKIMQEFNLKKF